MEDRIRELVAEAQSAIEAANTEAELDQVRVGFLGRKGRITQILRSLSELPADRRPALGAAANRAKREIGDRIESRAAALACDVGPPSAGGLDLTLPGIRTYRGHRHPLTIIQEELERIFAGLGFEIVEGPEIETEYYNFIALNIPPHHPIRDQHDSFYITDDVLLRTETSAVQIRTMESRKPPVRIVSTGRCFRRDAVDATHSHTFYQIEGLYVDRHVTMAQLKGTLRILIDELYGPQLDMRFRPDYFPFVEPGAEVAFTCPKCEGTGCGLCGSTGWLELGGAGMVHPNVLENVGYDSEEYTGFAFGLGIERIAMQKFGISDIRTFLQGDLRLLRQF
jgi:phenylalanyl-tRNA synthetase alpha chain